MSKKRIYEYAKELNVKSKEIIDELKKMDVEVSNHMQALEDGQIKMLDKKFKSSQNEENKKQNTQNNHQKQQSKKDNNQNKSNSKKKTIKIAKTIKTTKIIIKVRITNLLLNLKKCLQKSRMRKVLQ